MDNGLKLPRRAAIGGAIAAFAAANAGPAIAAVPKRMRAYEIGDAGDGITMHIVERPMPKPKDGQVLLKIHATGLNARDLSLLRRFRIYGGAGDRPTLIPLDDNACEVAVLGKGANKFKIGDRVAVTHFPLWTDGPWNDDVMSKVDFSVNTDGFLAEYIAVDERGVVKIPDAMSFEEACTLPNAGLTAWNAVVVDGEVRPGQTVVTLGSGGVSVFCMQWAKMIGARVAITSSSDEKLARLRELGADITINYRTHPNWYEELRRQTGGQGANAVMNTVGISEMENCLMACASNARVMLIGANPVARGGASNETVGLKDFPRPMIMKGLTIKGVIVGSRKMLEDAYAAAATNGVKPVLDRVFDFENALDAVRYMESGAKIGKIVIKVA